MIGDVRATLEREDHGLDQMLGNVHDNVAGRMKEANEILGRESSSNMSDPGRCAIVIDYEDISK